MSTAVSLRTLLIISLAIFLFAGSLPVSANSDAATTAAVTTKKVKKEKNVDLSCMQTAVTVREEALVTALSSFHDDLESSLNTRKSALIAAWGITEKTTRSAAIKNAWADWKTDKKDATKDLGTARKAAWDTFKSTVKTSCKETLPKEESLGVDEKGTISL